MNLINANDYETAWIAFLSAKAHPMLNAKPTTIICTKKQYNEIISGMMDEDVKEYIETEDGAEIYGVCRIKYAEYEFCVFLKIENESA